MTTDETDNKTQFRHRRGSCIVELKNQRGEDCILLAEQFGGVFLLPGGRAKRNESRMIASIRELYEETTLKPKATLFIAECTSKYNLHKVFYHSVDPFSSPTAQDDVKALHLYNPHQPNPLFWDRCSLSTQTMIQDFMIWKTKHEPLLNALKEM